MNIQAFFVKEVSDSFSSPGNRALAEAVSTHTYLSTCWLNDFNKFSKIDANFKTFCFTKCLLNILLAFLFGLFGSALLSWREVNIVRSSYNLYKSRGMTWQNSRLYLIAVNWQPPQCWKLQFLKEYLYLPRERARWVYKMTCHFLAIFHVCSLLQFLLNFIWYSEENIKWPRKLSSLKLRIEIWNLGQSNLILFLFTLIVSSMLLKTKNFFTRTEL